MANTYTELSREEFESFRPINNNVVVEIPSTGTTETLKSGIIIIKDVALIPTYTTDQVVKDPSLVETVNNTNEADLAARWGIVAKIPDHLSWNSNGKMHDKMDWDTDIEVSVGDSVWFTYFCALHCPILTVEDKKYWIIPYQTLVVAKTPEIRMLNGYILFERFNDGLKSKFLELPEHINKKKGFIKYVGSKNRDYTNKNKCDDIDVSEGDFIMFRNEVETLLEAKEHRKFASEDYRYAQRCDISAVYEDYHE
jgi:co-chaperonin GroES (HSP10)